MPKFSARYLGHEFTPTPPHQNSHHTNDQITQICHSNAVENHNNQRHHENTMSHAFPRDPAPDPTGGSPTTAAATTAEADRVLIPGPEFVANHRMIEGMVANEDHFLINLGPVVDEDQVRPEALHAEDDEEDEEGALFGI
jgi:hypothetical protein